MALLEKLTVPSRTIMGGADTRPENCRAEDMETAEAGRSHLRE